MSDEPKITLNEGNILGVLLIGAAHADDLRTNPEVLRDLAARLTRKPDEYLTILDEAMKKLVAGVPTPPAASAAEASAPKRPYVEGLGYEVSGLDY